MRDLQSRAGKFEEAFDALKPLLAATGPAWLSDVREAAIRRYREFGLPTTRDEEFKYTPVRPLEEGSFSPAYGAVVSRADLDPTPLGSIDAITVTFVNGQAAPELTSVDVLPEGVFVGTFADAAEAFPAEIERWLTKVATYEGKLGSTNDSRFADLNTAFLGEGAFVYVPRSVTLERAIHLQFISKADREAIVFHPRTLVVLEENAEAKIVESYVGLGGKVFSNAVTEIALGPNARLEHAKYQEETLESVHMALIAITQEGGSVYTGVNAAFGSAVAKTEVNVWVNGEHAETWLNGAYVGRGEQILDNHTRIDHAKPNCNSFEVYKGILDDRSVGVFNGKIFVYEDAQKTDAKQTNQAILLSPTATINTKPQLEIFADDVKCTHGATVGQLREDAMFYLRARGIPEREAASLLVYAFAAEVIDHITLDDVRDALEKALFRKLGRA